MRWGGVDNACAGVHGDVVGQHAEDFAIEEGMLKVQPLHLAAGEVGEFVSVFETAFRGHIGGQPCRDNVNFAAGFEGNVIFAGMEGHRHRSGQRPGRGGPDDGRDFFARKGGIDLCGIVEQGVLYPNRGADVVLIFDFGFGERGLVVHAPIDGAQALVHEIVFVKGEEGLSTTDSYCGVMVA